MTAAAALLGRAARAGFGLRPLLLWMVRGYRAAISPALPKACRFEPSCACYAEGALARHEVARALWLIARRLLRSHPFHPGGYDPCPSRNAGAHMDRRTFVADALMLAVLLIYTIWWSARTRQRQKMAPQTTSQQAPSAAGGAPATGAGAGAGS